jgi:AbrB family looped-hinge helix DNA binding protein
MGRLTAKGQVTVPKQVREHLGLKPGAEVEFDLADDGRVVLRPAASPRAAIHSRFTRFRGRARPGLSTDEYMKLVRGYGEDDLDPGLR